MVIGGATRVMEAGLACPDWPLCYGTLLPGRQMNVQVFLEWFHRLDAFVVGVALLVMASSPWFVEIAAAMAPHRSAGPGFWLRCREVSAPSPFSICCRRHRHGSPGVGPHPGGSAERSHPDSASSRWRLPHPPGGRSSAGLALLAVSGQSCSVHGWPPPGLPSAVWPR